MRQMRLGAEGDGAEWSQVPLEKALSETKRNEIKRNEIKRLRRRRELN